MLTLPNGKSQFLDANGKPYAGGKVFHYVPSTSMPKETYQDIGGTILNENPLTLDSFGEAVILGSGSYRQVLTDKLGNQIWDQVTQTASLTVPVPLSGGTMTGALSTPSLSVPGGQLLTVTPTGDAVSTLVSLSVQGSTISTTTREYLAAISLISNKRNGASGAVSPTSALYTGIQAQSGTGDVWSIKTDMVLDAGSGTFNAIAHEIDAVNNVGDRGNTLGSAGLAAPTAYGHVVSNTGANRNTSGYLITGSADTWNRGITIANNSVVAASIQDLGHATISYEIQGTHNIGIDMHAANCAGAGIWLGNGHYIIAQNLANTGHYTIAIQSGANMFIGDTTATGIVANNHLFPVTDNTYTVGASGFRWSAVWAANGTIQTSDPALKTDITPLVDLPVEVIISAIRPIRFRWKSGGTDADGNDIPGKRLHWGWDAENVKAAFDLVGSDFGGFVLSEDGTKHLRPDQLIPVLWRAVQKLTERVAALEGKA